MAVTALVGNGLSISYNPAMRVDALTKSLLDDFKEAGGDLSAISEGAEAKHLDGFEALLGQFDEASRLLSGLPGMSSSSIIGGQLEQIEGALAALRAVYRSGVAVALRRISQLARGSGRADWPVKEFCTAVEELAPPSDRTVATLNYDGLLHYGFLQDSHSSDWCDMAVGWGSQTEPVDFSGGVPLESWSLRTEGNFIKDRARLLNLHGSLGWLRRSSARSSEYRKFRLDDLRDCDYWSKLQSGDTDWEPVVVLTNTKDSVPERYPFSVAYEEFQMSLVESTHWLVAGYGFGDSPVNSTLGRAAAIRNTLGAKEPRVLVIDTGKNKKLHRQASQLLGLSDSSLCVADAGLPDAVRGSDWVDWASGLD